MAKASPSLATFLIRNFNRELFVCGKDQLGCLPFKNMQGWWVEARIIWYKSKSYGLYDMDQNDLNQNDMDQKI